MRSILRWCIQCQQYFYEMMMFSSRTTEMLFESYDLAIKIFCLMCLDTFLLLWSIIRNMHQTWSRSTTRATNHRKPLSVTLRISLLRNQLLWNFAIFEYVLISNKMICDEVTKVFRSFHNYYALIFSLLENKNTDKVISFIYEGRKMTWYLLLNHYWINIVFSFSFLSFRCLMFSSFFACLENIICFWQWKMATIIIAHLFFEFQYRQNSLFLWVSKRYVHFISLQVSDISCNDKKDFSADIVNR